MFLIIFTLVIVCFYVVWAEELTFWSRAKRLISEDVRQSGTHSFTKISLPRKKGENINTPEKVVRKRSTGNEKSQYILLSLIVERGQWTFLHTFTRDKNTLYWLYWLKKGLVDASCKHQKGRWLSWSRQNTQRQQEPHTALPAMAEVQSVWKDAGFQ